MAKRAVALVLMLIMVLTPVIVVSAMNTDIVSLGADGAFYPRLKAPSYSNKYYYSDLNKYERYGYGMPNCTAYAWGRAYEIMGYEPDLSLNDADTWWDYNKENHSYNYGKVPKLGAIACWEYSYGGGHVAVVEVIKDGEITFSNSAYGGDEFYLSYADVDDPNAGGDYWTWNFKGYIYITEGQSKEDYYASLGGDVYRVDSSDGINLRKGPGTSYNTLTAIPDKTEIVVTNTKSADGYTWGKTTFDGYSGWCVLDFTQLIYKKAEAETTPETTLPEVTEPTETTPPEATEPSETNPATFDEATPDQATPDEAVTEPTEPEIEEILLGDANGDGKISITDATTIQKHLAKIGEIGDNNKKLADISCDGKLTVTDVSMIQKKLAGIIRSYI